MLIHRESLEQLLYAIQSLPSDQGSALVSHAFNGLMVDEIAASLRISPSTVKSRLRLAREKLQEKLKHVAPETVTGGRQ